MLSSAKSVNNTSRRTGSSGCDIIGPSKSSARARSGLSTPFYCLLSLVSSRTALLDPDSVLCYYLAALHYVVTPWTYSGLLCGIGLLVAFDGEFSRVLRLLVI